MDTGVPAVRRRTRPLVWPQRDTPERGLGWDGPPSEGHYRIAASGDRKGRDSHPRPAPGRGRPCSTAWPGHGLSL